jgi:putative tryptophan/tyrosine transport system substrate-binding protein
MPQTQSSLEEATMTRRTLGLLITLMLSCLWSSLAVAALPPGKMPRIGVLAFGSPPMSPDWQARWPFVQELRTLGWLEGQNMVLEYRWAEGQASRLPPLADELLRLPVDVLVVVGTPAIRAAQHATTTIPIVIISAGDPVAVGLVADLARPGGNITGIGGLVPELSGKLLELLTEAVPGVTRMAILEDSTNPRTARMARATERAAQALGVHTQHLGVWSPDQFEPALKAARREGAGALVVLPSDVAASHQSEIAALALQNGLPAIFWSEQFAEVGGLMAYGPSWPHLWQRAAAQIDKILKGAKPADLPVERPMKFELVVNLKTAQTLGLSIPPTLLFQADKIIR